MRFQTKNLWALRFAACGIVILLASCFQKPPESAHDLVYQELTKTVPDPYRLINILATNNSIQPSEDPNISYMTIAPEGIDFITVVAEDTIPQPCPPPKPPCVQMALEGRLPFSGTDSVFAFTSFYPDTSFQKGEYNVEVMVRALPERVRGSLLTINKILPGERVYIMKVSPR